MDCSTIYNCCKIAGNTFYGSSSNLCQLQGIQFHGIEFGKTRHSLAESQFCCHVNTSAVAPIVTRSGTNYMTFLACYRKFLQSHSSIHILFPNSSIVKLFLMGYKIITNEVSSSVNNSVV